MTDEKEKTGEDTTVSEVPAKEESKKVVIDNLYCPTCKERKLDADLDKQPLGSITKEDGTVEADFTRCTIFCKKCQTMLTVFDPGAVKEMENIKKARS